MLTHFSVGLQLRGLTIKTLTHAAAFSLHYEHAVLEPHPSTAGNNQRRFEATHNNGRECENETEQTRLWQMQVAPLHSAIR